MNQISHRTWIEKRGLVIAPLCVLKLLLVLHLSPLTARAAEIPSPSTSRILTNAAQVRALTPEAAKLRYPAKFRGVVTFFDQKAFTTCFIQDATSGIYVHTVNLRYYLDIGDVAEVEGYSDAADFAPAIWATNVVSMGKGQLPDVRPVSFEQLSTGAEDSQWVEISGIVRSVTEDLVAERLVIEMATGGGRLMTRIRDYDRATNYQYLVDSRVRIRGVCVLFFNQQRQFFNVRLLVPGMAQVLVDEAASPASFDLAVRPINSLLRFAPLANHGHRVHVRGVVTYYQPGRTLFIRDQTQGLMIETRESFLVQEGDEVEALGFPASGEWTPILQDATFRKVGVAGAPLPLALTPEAALQGNHNADLVTMDAILVDRAPRATEEVLLLQSSNFIFNAELKRVEGKESLDTLAKGTHLRLRGICLAQVGDNRYPYSFHLLLRSPRDVVVLKQPSWWTLTRLVAALGVLSMTTLAGWVWIGSLRRHVRAQTAIISRKIHQEGVLQERHRMAREIHDTLVQSFAAISLQLEAFRDKAPPGNERISPHLELAYRLARESLTEARRSIWALHSETSLGAGLAASLAASLKTITEGTEIQSSIRAQGEAAPLSADVENNLLYIGREAIHNAVNHAAPKHISVELLRRDNNLSLVVQDDGVGFDVSKTQHGLSVEHRGFGMISIQERATQIGAQLSLHSKRGEGTTVRVDVPLNAT